MRGNDEGPTSSQEDMLSVLVVAGEPGDVEQFPRAPEPTGSRWTRRVVQPRGWRGSGGQGSIWRSGTPPCRRSDLARGRSLVLDNRPPVLFLITCGYLHTCLPELGGGEGGLRHQALPDDRDPGADPGPVAGRRPHPRAGMPRHGDLVLDDVAGNTRRDARRPLDLTPAEYRLLRHLLINAGQVLAKEQVSLHGRSDWRATERCPPSCRRPSVTQHRPLPGPAHESVPARGLG